MSAAHHKHATPSKTRSHFGWESPKDDDQVNSNNCTFCKRSLSGQTDVQKSLHYQHHFLEAQDKKEGSSQSGINFAKKLVGIKQDKETFWYPSSSSPPPPNYHPGMIKLLQWALKKFQVNGHTRRAVLCYEQAVHIPRECWDAHWGCGYRNFLMACAALMDQQLQPLYFPHLDFPIPPGVRNLQRWIEDAWKDGFDEEGRKELKKLVDTKKWIGTSDLWVAFTYRGIPAELVEFKLESSGVQPLIDWIVSYFSSNSLSQTKDFNVRKHIEGVPQGEVVRTTDRMPIILQHNGHSRTIVGYEVTKKGEVNLLTFDPSKVPKPALRQAALSLWGGQSVGNPDSSSSPHNGSPSKHRGIREYFSSVPHASSQQKRKTSLESSPVNRKRSRQNNTQPIVSGTNTSDVGGKTPVNGLGESNLINLADDTEDDGEVEVVPDTPAKGTKKQTKNLQTKLDPWAETVQPNQVLAFFRLEPQKLGKKQYQILYFPMTAPLTDRERNARKVVRSTRYC